MPLLPLALPPGLWRNGTPYTGKGRWERGALVRWTEAAVQPMWGWRRLYDFAAQADTAPLFADPTVEAPRGAFRWRTLDGDVWTAFGSNRGLYAVDKDGTPFDITPAGFTGESRLPGLADNGYGLGLYGREAYGVERQNALRLPKRPNSWSFDTWGEDLVAAHPADGVIYRWSPNLPSSPAAAISGAPTSSRGIAVTDQRILVSIGDDTVTRLVRWSDTEDDTVWTPDSTNQAGFQTLAGRGDLKAIAKVGDVHLILSDSDAHVMRYVGPPFVFGFRQLADNICLKGAGAVISVGGKAYWWGRRTFWSSDGNSVTPLPCDVLDYVTADADPDRFGLTQTWVSTCNREIWWHYASRGSATGENDKYVVYSYTRGHWYCGEMNRCNGVGKAGPIAIPEWRIDPAGVIYEHEVSGLALPEPAQLVSGPLELGQGDNIIRVTRVHPDTPVRNPGATNGADSPDATITLLCRDDPNGPERSYGPYDLSRPTAVRARGREVRVRVDIPSPRVLHGIARLEVQSGGRR